MTPTSRPARPRAPRRKSRSNHPTRLSRRLCRLSPFVTRKRATPARLEWLFDFLPVQRLLEGGDSARFVIVDIENGIELGHLQHILHLLGQVQQLHIGALILGRSECAYQLAQ